VRIMGRGAEVVTAHGRLDYGPWERMLVKIVGE
jgi:hypothetical protein